MEISGDKEGLALVHAQTNLGSPGHWGLHWGQAREMLWSVWAEHISLQQVGPLQRLLPPNHSQGRLSCSAGQAVLVSSRSSLKQALSWHPLLRWDVWGLLLGHRMPPCTGATAYVSMPSLLGLGFISPGYGGVWCNACKNHRCTVSRGDLVLSANESSSPF